MSDLSLNIRRKWLTFTALTAMAGDMDFVISDVDRDSYNMSAGDF